MTVCRYDLRIKAPAYPHDDKGKSKAGERKGKQGFSDGVPRTLFDVWNLGTQACQESAEQVNAVNVRVMPSLPSVQSSASSVAPSSVGVSTKENLCITQCSRRI